MKKNIFFVFLLLSFMSFTNRLSAQWTIAGEMDVPVAGGQALVSGSKIYILGGFSAQTQAPTNLIQEYDPLTDNWRVVGTMKDSRYGLSAGLFDDKIFYFGGVIDSSEFSNIAEAFSLSVFDLAAVAGTHDSFNRVFSSSAKIDRRLYIFGGSPPQPFDTLFLPYASVFDYDSQTIISEVHKLYVSSDLPIKQMSAVVEDEILIFGGVSNTILSKVYRFDRDLEDFTRITPDMNLPKAGSGLVTLPDKNEIYIIGGLNEVESATATVEVFVKNGTQYESYLSDNLLIARSDLMAVNFNGVIYVFGGFNIEGNVVSEIETYNASTTFVREEKIPVTFSVLQNYPNPFNPSTTITFSIKNADRIKIEIFSSSGEQVITLYDKLSGPGMHSIIWEGNSSSGNLVPSGVYLYKVSDSFNNYSARKMTLIR